MADEGRCVSCGFLGKRDRRTETAQRYPGTYEVEWLERLDPAKARHGVQLTANAYMPTELVCYRGAASLPDEIAKPDSTEEARAVLWIDRKCKFWRQYIPGHDPKEHLVELRLPGPTKIGEPIERVEDEVRRFLSVDSVRDYPKAYEHWKKAEELVSGPDGAAHLKDIGFRCRQALQALGGELAAKHDVSNIDPDPEKWKNRVMAVVRAKAGDTVTELIETLSGYVDKLNELVQRQVHSGGTDVEDARMVVFQTAMLMYEAHRAASRTQLGVRMR